MIRRCAFGLLLAGLLISIVRPQVGPLPGVAVLPPPIVAACVPAATNIGTNNNTAGSTLTLTGVTVPAGSLIVVVAGEISGSGNGSVSDGVNTYVAVGGVSNLKFYYAANASLSSGTITYNKKSSGHETSISAIYASNILTSSPEDSAVRASTTATGSSISLVSGTPGASGELFVAGLFLGHNVTTVTQDTADGWAFPPNTITGSATTLSGGTLVNPGSGTQTWAPVFGVSSNPVNAAIIGFKHC